MNNDKLIVSLSFFIIFDYSTTIVAVLGMGATEINPFYKFIPGMYEFLVIKFVLGIICLAIIIQLQEHKKIVGAGLIVLNTMYGIVVCSNLWQIVTHVV